MNMNIRIVDTPVDPEAGLRASSSPTVVYRNTDGKDFYKVWIYLDGPDVPFVRSVTYELHPTFQQRVHEVSRSAANPSCALIIWTWGIFSVKCTVRTKSGASTVLTHKLTYDQLFQKQKVKFVQE